MQGTIKQVTGQAGLVLLELAAVSILVLALMGQMPEVAAGWLMTPALLVGEDKRRHRLERRRLLERLSATGTPPAQNLSGAFRIRYRGPTA